MSSNHCFEFEFPAQIYKNHKQQLSNKARKGEQKIGRARSIYSWSRWVGVMYCLVLLSS